MWRERNGQIVSETPPDGYVGFVYEITPFSHKMKNTK